jgi:hypothetical protein
MLALRNSVSSNDRGVKSHCAHCAINFHALVVSADESYGGLMTLLKKPLSADLFAGMIWTACVLMAMIGIFSVAGCAAVVDRSGAPARTSGDISSSPCVRMLKANWSIALGPTEGSQCGSKFPEATIYRDEEANLPSTQKLQMSNDSQIGLFTPFWVIF